jgi:pyruvate, orthophosphate dikinase
MNELALLQLARVKGLLSVEAASIALAADPDAVKHAFADFQTQGWLNATPRGWRLSPAGRTITAQRVEAERSGLPSDRLRELYQAFCEVNAELKATITAWQLRPDGVPNDHSDAAYDKRIVARLAEHHAKSQAIVQRIVEAAPRLGHYPRRLEHALERLREGDMTYMARPITDSYHTVWFELHQDLIGLAGTTRQKEAAAGRAL